jgi:hypothetical protein
MNNEIKKLLKILKAHPEFIRDITFHSPQILQWLGANARTTGLAGPVSATQFMTYIADPRDGHPIAFCGGGTKAMYGKGTQVWVENPSTRRRKIKKKKRKT